MPYKCIVDIENYENFKYHKDNIDDNSNVSEQLKKLKSQIKEENTNEITDLENRLIQHDNGLVKSTKERRPLKLIYFEVSLNSKDATHREKYLKTSWGKRYIKQRLKNYLTG